MVSVNFAKNEHIELISEFEKNYFNNEAYSFETLLWNLLLRKNI